MWVNHDMHTLFCGLGWVQSKPYWVLYELLLFVVRMFYLVTWYEDIYITANYAAVNLKQMCDCTV